MTTTPDSRAPDDYSPPRDWVSISSVIDAKIRESSKLLYSYVRSPSVGDLVDGLLDADGYVVGTVPRISPFDYPYLPSNLELISIPHEIATRMTEVRRLDIAAWNQPSHVLRRLRGTPGPFRPPVAAASRLLARAEDEQRVLSFGDLRLRPPVPTAARSSRRINYHRLECNIMGRWRIPLALGSVPDVGSRLAYVTMAQANGLVFISRDKVLSDPERQVRLVHSVIEELATCEIDPAMRPGDAELQQAWPDLAPGSPYDAARAAALYETHLRDRWIGNIGAAIEASSKGVDRARMLHAAGCRTFRIYSPEGGLEILDTISSLRAIEGFASGGVNIVAGQAMDVETALRAEDAGCDAVIIGVAGGSQCTTSVNADIPVDTPGLLHRLRGRLGVPVGIEGGGVGTHMMTAFALGASFVCKPGEIGLSFEGVGGSCVFRDDRQTYWMLYGGEASDAAKWWRGSLDDLGRPMFVEGETGIRRLPPSQYYMTSNIRRLLQQIAVGLVFQRTDCIAELHQRDCSNIVAVSAQAAGLSRAYGDV